MAWKTTTPMDERIDLISDYHCGGWSIAELARRYTISRKTVYKWIERYAEESVDGLKERSRAPHVQAGAVSEEMVDEILALKARWPLWGAPKLHWKLREKVGVESCPAESTVSNILHRHGLTKAPRRRRSPLPAPAMDYGQRPNEVWCADFKGWWKLGNGERCTPLTITDACSRYLIRCPGLGTRTTAAEVQPVFIAAFRENGLPLALRNDNGPPFASQGLQGLTTFSVWLLKLGIALDRIAPGHPEQNGRHERMHRTMKEYLGEPARNLAAQQKRLLAFREEYNHQRPHEALNFAVPAAVYEPSLRQWSDKRRGPMAYSDDWETRAVRGCGQMQWRGVDVQITKALVGERIGLRPVGDGLWEVYFGTFELGRFDERKGRVDPPKKVRRQKAPTGEETSGTPAPLRCAGAPEAPSPVAFPGQ
jgi:transposase InsO family protein